LRCTYRPLRDKDEIDKCEGCFERVSTLSNFFQKVELIISKFVEKLQDGDDEMGLNLAARELEKEMTEIIHRNVMEQIYSCAMLKVEGLEQTFERKLKLAKLTDDDFSRVTKSTLLKLTPGEEELKNLNNYKDPDDKCQCILRCWYCVETYAGVTEVDDKYDCMAYIIYKVRPTSLLSNVKYITLYVSEREEYHLGHFVDSILALDGMLDSAIERAEIISAQLILQE